MILREESRLLESHGHVVIHYGRDNDELKGKTRVRCVDGSRGDGLVVFELQGGARNPKEAKAGRRALSQHVPADLALGLLRLRRGGSARGADAAQLPAALPGGFDVARWKSVRIMPGAGNPLAGSRPCMLSRQPPRYARDCGDARCPSRASYLREKVNVYIVLSEFARGKFIEGGLPADRIVVKSNFVADRSTRRASRGGYALFVGRLSEEKGPRLLPTAWQAMETQIPLRLVGDGPLREQLRDAVERSGQVSRIELMGRRASDEVAALMAGARFLVLPSVWFENFPYDHCRSLFLRSTGDCFATRLDGGNCPRRRNRPPLRARQRRRSGRESRVGVESSRRHGGNGACRPARVRGEIHPRD